MKKTVEVLFTRTDERAFSALLTAAFPMVSFIDDDVWPTPEPPLVPSIEQCKTSYCFVWNRAIYATQRSTKPCVHGGFYGPVVPAIQFLRPRLTDSVLRAGRMASVMDDNDVADLPMVPFIQAVWKLAKKFAKYRADFVDPVTREITTARAYNTIVGPDATAWCLADDNRFFKNNPGNFFLRPSAQQESGKAAKRRRK